MTATDSGDGLLEETLSRLFTERSGPQDRQTAEAAGWASGVWDALADAGLPWVGVPEEAGGPGGGVEDACRLVHLTGRYAVALPLAECALLGGWLVAAGGLQLPGGPLSVAPSASEDDLHVDEDGRVSGRLSRVPWGARATVVALANSRAGQRVVLIDPIRADVEPGHNVAGEPRDTLQLHQVPLSPEEVGDAPFDLGPELALRGALSRALLMAGAMEAVADLTLDYANQRHQFGRPIAAFQAVAQRLVRLSSEAQAAALTADVAARRFAESGIGASFEVAVAKASASRAASEVATHAHQVHGAIGMTQEYPLHQFTRRLWAWRQEWGSERRWAETVGRQVAEGGGGGRRFLYRG
jgi:acyl-CoA dehydrogenase